MHIPPAAVYANSLTSQSGSVGMTVAFPPSVVVVDSNGFPVTDAAVTFSITAGGGSTSPVGTVSTNAQGVASLTSWTLGAAPGVNTILATVFGLASGPPDTDVTFTATGTSVAATTIAAETPTSQQAVVSTQVPTAPGVRVTDAGGNPVANVELGVSIGGGGSIGNFIIPALTDANGRWNAVSWRLGATPGANTVTITATGLSGSPVVFSATALSAGATTISANSTLSQSAQVSTNVDSPPSVRVTDAGGLPVSGITVGFAVTAGGGSVAPSSVVTDGSGVATLTSWTVGGSLGANTVQASVPGLSGSPITFSATGTAGAPGAGTNPTQISANSSTSQSAQVGAAVTAPPSVLVRDAGSVAVPGVTVTFTVVSGGGQISSATVVTNGSGIATLASWILGSAPGTNNNVVHASVSGLTGSPVAFTASGTVGTGQLNPAAYFEVLYVPAVEKFYASGGAQTVGGTQNVVRAFDARTRTHLTDIVVADNVRGMAYANGKVYVAISGGNIGVIDTATDTLLSTITIAGTWHRGVYVPTTDRVVFVQNTTGVVIQIDPSADTQATLVASVACVGQVLYCDANDRLYIPLISGVAVYNPSTGALVTTITGSIGNTEAGPATYAPGTPDTIVVGATASGSTQRIALISTATNTVRTLLGIGATGALNQARYASGTGKVYVIHSPAGAASDMFVATVDPFTDTLERTDGGVRGYSRMTGYMPEHDSVWLTGGTSVIPLMLWNVRSRGPVVRSLVTASQSTAPHVTLTEGRPFAPGDLVTFRRNADGAYRVRLEWPTQITALNGLRREVKYPDDTVRGERNYVLNPWARDWFSDYAAPHWVLPTTLASRWYDRDASAWTTFVAQADGAQSGTVTSLALKAMTPGDVLLPGDYLDGVGNTHVIGRVVVDGAGEVVVPIASTSVSVADSGNVTIRRPPEPTFLVPGQGVALYPNGAVSREGGVNFTVPYYEGLSQLWVTGSCYLWVATGAIQPSLRMALVLTDGPTTVTTLAALDANSYSDPAVLVGPLDFSFGHTLTPGSHLIGARLRLNLTGETARGVIYPTRFQATLGPEENIQPPMEFNADYGALFHAGQRVLRDRGQAPVTYQLQAREDPQAPFELGGRVDLRHPTAGTHATPRLLSITRIVTPHAHEPEAPVIQLDNLPPSLARRLSSSGVS